MMKVLPAAFVMLLLMSHPFCSLLTGAQKLHSHASSPSPDSCAMNEFEGCLLLIKSVTDSEELAFATTMQDLGSACRKLQNGLKCADDHMRRCVSRNQRQVFEEVVKGTRDVITKLCIPGSTQMNYLKYSGCYKNVSKSETKCLPWFRKIQEMDVQVQEIQHENIDEGLERFCCTFRKAYECQVYHLRHDCGPDALRFFEQNLNEMSNSLIHRHCISFADKSCNDLPDPGSQATINTSSYNRRAGSSQSNSKGRSHTSMQSSGPPAFRKDRLFYFCLILMFASLKT